MARGVQYPTKTRATVVAEIATGESIAVVAQRWGIPKATVVGWWVEDRPVEPSDARTRERMAFLIYDTLTDLLTAVRAQLQAASGEEWLAKQTAGELAGLLGTEVDRAVRLLAGFRPTDPELPEPEVDTTPASDSA